MSNIFIIGSGAVGIAVGSTLINSGENVTFFARGATKEALLFEGCRREGALGALAISPDRCSVTDSYGISAPFDFILVTAKALANEEIADSLSRHSTLFHENTKIVIMQNGLGIIDPFEKRFDKSVIYNARVITGCSRPAPNVSAISIHRDLLLLGSLYSYPASVMEPIADALSRSGFPSATCDEIEKPIWYKIIYNCALNPLSALFGKPYGFLGDCPSMREYVSHIIDEAYEVMYASGHSTYIQTAEEYKRIFFEETLPLSYSHRSSTLQDIEKKQKTEIDTLNGAIAALGKSLGVPTPYNDALTLIIRAIEFAY